MNGPDELEQRVEGNLEQFHILANNSKKKKKKTGTTMALTTSSTSLGFLYFSG